MQALHSLRHLLRPMEPIRELVPDDDNNLSAAERKPTHDHDIEHNPHRAELDLEPGLISFNSLERTKLNAPSASVRRPDQRLPGARSVLASEASTTTTTSCRLRETSAPLDKLQLASGKVE